MRLGDLDALKKHKFTTQIRNGVAIGEIEVVPVAEIDNAPTVEPCYQTTSCLDCKNYDKANYYCPRFCEVIREATKEIKRPQGEWIIIKDEKYGDNVKCPFCNKELAGTDLNFCCKCGAKLIGSEKMKGGAE